MFKDGKQIAFVAALTLAAWSQAFAAETEGRLQFSTPRPIKIAPVGGGDQTPVTDFTCDSSNHQCQCQGSTDCFDLGGSHLCVDGTLKEDNRLEGYTCQFKY